MLIIFVSSYTKKPHFLNMGDHFKYCNFPIEFLPIYSAVLDYNEMEGRNDLNNKIIYMYRHGE